MFKRYERCDTLISYLVFGGCLLHKPNSVVDRTIYNYFLLVATRNNFWIILLSRHFSWLYLIQQNFSNSQGMLVNRLIIDLFIVKIRWFEKKTSKPFSLIGCTVNQNFYKLWIFTNFCLNHYVISEEKPDYQALKAAARHSSKTTTQTECATYLGL